MEKLRKIYRILRRYYRQSKISKDSSVKIFNYHLYNNKNYSLLQTESVENHWLAKFIIEKKYLANTNKTVSIFGVNGDRLAIHINRSDYKIFYTVENVHVKLSPWYQYQDLLINDMGIDLSLGFDYVENNKYLRFPYWLMTLFEPTDNYEIIKQKCNHINKILSIDNRLKFCPFICRNDYFGDRKYFLEEVQKIGYINCPGNFMHNDDDLSIIFNDDKIKYLQQFKFNLCPENSNNNGYVTEKIFDSIKAGCIPIYWGSNNQPEADILNQNAIFFLNLHANNEDVLKEIKKIYLNENLYKIFILQNKLTSKAPDIIYNYFQNLDKKLKEIFKTINS